MKISQEFQTALQYYEEGKLDDAAAVCREILTIEPNYPDAVHLLAMLYYQGKDYTRAVSYIEKALQLNPDDFYASFLLGTLSQEQGNIEKAATCFQKAIELNPSFADAHYNLAIILEKTDQLEEALISYKESLALNPNLADVHNNVGNLLLKLKRFDEAVPYLVKALQLKPGYVLALNNMGMALKGQGHLDEAILHFRKAIELDPSFADAHYNLAIVLQEKDKADEAITLFQRAIELKPAHADAYYNLAILLKETDRADEAIPFFQRAVELNPFFADAYCNLAIIFEESGMLNDALSYYQKALQSSPDDAEINWNVSHALLSSGSFKEGWRKYEWRFEVKDFKQRGFPLPRWDGSSLEEKTLFIYAEQGVGEEIMFASCLPEVIAQADSCVIECDKRLVPLFTRSFPKAKVIHRLHSWNDFPHNIPSVDMKTAIGSLPLFLRSNLTSFPQYQAYLKPDPLKVEGWRNRFAVLGAGSKIGISWRGGGKASEKRLRSTVLEQWTALFSVPGVHFVNLQYGDCSGELREAGEKSGVTIHHWEDADPLKDLDGFAAQISALDLVISVDNATVHMAGALGVPVWTLLPFACDWRWMREYEDTPWYTTVRLFRQSSRGDWNKVFGRVASYLRHYISTGVIPSIPSEYSYKSIREAEKASRPVKALSVSRAYHCAIVTPVGPGHKRLYRECLTSVEASFAGKKGNFSGILPIRIDDPEGKMGRSKARNIGIRKAAEQHADWIFFLDADDIMAPSAFEYVSPYLEMYDAIWGSIWTIERGEYNAGERPHQLPFLYSIEEVLSYDPFVTLQMGHFVKTPAALSTLFDESLDTGEDFDYYLRLWEKYACIKIPLPLFFNRRGLHSRGPRSATGQEWKKGVEEIIKKKSSQGLISIWLRQ
jgi:tetratricopeptide (TPR) repeat protein